MTPSNRAATLFDTTPAVWPAFLLLLQFQQQQWQWLLAWQQSLLAMHSDLNDQWLSRWADGARLDD